MRRLLRVAAPALLAALAAAIAAAEGGTVRGTVRGPGGPPAGLKVVIESAADSSYAASATTDAEGSFSFSDVPVGEVEVKVYDGEDELVVGGKGLLERAGETITLLLQPGA